MTYPVTGLFSTPYRLALMLAECATVQLLLEAGSVAHTLEKITTYSEDEMPLPRVIIHVENEQIALKSDSELGYVESQHRSIGAEFQIYIPEDDDSIARTSDQHNYVLAKMGAVLNEMLALAGTGEPIAGTTHLRIYDPVLYMPQRIPLDERFDQDEIDRGFEARPLWFTMLAVEIH
jgi:hypothetical protein